MAKRSTRYLTHSLPTLVTHKIDHVKRNSISPSKHVLFCFLYKHCTKKKSTFFALPFSSWQQMEQVICLRPIKIPFFQEVEIPRKYATLYYDVK